MTTFDAKGASVEDDEDFLLALLERRLLFDLLGLTSHDDDDEDASISCDIVYRGCAFRV